MNLQEQPTEKTEYSGTPTEVGAQLAMDALGPTIQAAAQHSTDQQLVQMMGGMVAAIAGVMADNFGRETAINMLRGIADNAEKHGQQLQQPN